MNHLPLIIKREYLTKVKNKSFIVMTFLSPIILIGIISLIVYLTQLNNNKKRTVSILDESGLVSQIFEADKDENLTYNILSTGLTLQEAKEQVEAKEEYGLLHIEKNSSIADVAKGMKFYSEDSPSLKFMSSLNKKLSEELTNKNLVKNLNVNKERIDDSEVNVEIAQESFSGEKTSKWINLSRLGFGIAAGYLLFMFIIIYGNMIMRSVIEEKTNRIIEVIISSVKPIQLMMGKIIGTSLAGITQFIIWVILGGIMVAILYFFFGVNLMGGGMPQQELMQQAMVEAPDMQMQIVEAIQALPITNLVIAFLVFFIGGYLLYSSLYAAIGAAVDNETDTQQFMMPILMPLMLAIYVGIFTVIEDPHGTVATVFSHIPFTSSVVMLMRIPFGVPIWEQVVSVVLLYITFTGTVWFASKIYRVGILMYGKKPSYKELFKWLKY